MMSVDPGLVREGVKESVVRASVAAGAHRRFSFIRVIIGHGSAGQITASLSLTSARLSCVPQTMPAGIAR